MIEILRKLGIINANAPDASLSPINVVGNLYEFDIHDTKYISLVALDAHPANVGEYPILMLLAGDGFTIILGSTVVWHEVTKVSVMHVLHQGNLIPYHIYLS